MKPSRPTTTGLDRVSGCTPCLCVSQLGPGQDSLTLYTEGDELIDVMLASISAARYRVCLESYIFADDAVGLRFAEALSERARVGVAVRLMVDALGSSVLFSGRLVRSMQESGVEVRRFHRWQWRKPFRYNRRDHRKLLVVDGCEAFLGGFNIHQQISRNAYGDRRWRDTHVRITGDLATHAEALFDTFWCTDRHKLPAETLNASSVLLSNHTRECRRRLHCLLVAIFADARESLSLTTPYFVPDYRLRKGLRQAAERGVEIRLLVPRISDVRVARWAANAIYGELLEAGVRVFEYLPRLIHAKTVVADRDICLLGTANLDYRSMFLNYELVLASRDRLLCDSLQDQFDADLSQSAEVHLEHWRRRRWIVRLAEALAWRVRRWL